MSLPVRVLTAVAPLALAAAAAVAQPIRATPPDPVLDRLVAEALAPTLETASARANVEAARRRITPAATLPDPSMGTTHQNDGSGLSLGEREGSFLGIMASQPLSWPGRLSLVGKAAESEARETRISRRPARKRRDAGDRRADRQELTEKRDQETPTIEGGRS